MTDKQAFTRAQVRCNRAAVRAAAAQRADATAEVLRGVLAKARKILADKEFVQLLYAHGVRSIPRAISPIARSAIKSRNGPSGGELLDCALEFVIAWTFLFPLFKRPEIGAYLDTAWPGFTLQMKDAFIAIVVEGPFPQAISGYQGRRHGAIYFPTNQRPIASKQQSV